MTKLNNESISIQQVLEVVTELVRQNQKLAEDVIKSKDMLQQLQDLITQQHVWKPFVGSNNYRDLIDYADIVHGERYITQVGYKEAAETLTQEVGWVVDLHNLRTIYNRNVKKQQLSRKMEKCPDKRNN